MSTLIIYGSKYGCTEKCARLLSKELRGNVDLYNIKGLENMDLSKYDAIIIGGSIYIGKIQKEIAKFCSKNIEQLMNKKIGLFICGMQEGETMIELHQNFDNKLIQVAKAKECFGGEFQFDKMNSLEKFIVKKVSKVTQDQSNILKDNIHRFANLMNE